MASGIAFSTRARATPVLLIHGFASSVRTNWIEPGWVEPAHRNRLPRHRLRQPRTRREREALRPKPYGAPLMAEDARRLLDHLGVYRADVMGYSMGARITAFLALAHPTRVRSAIFGGLGGNMVRPMAGTGPIAHALEAASIDDVNEPDRAHLPRLRRADRRRPQGAGRLHPRLAGAPDARDGRQHRLPGAGRHRHRGRHRRAAPTSSQR